MCLNGVLSHQQNSSQAAQRQTPFELLFGRSPVLDQIRVFGCLCYAHNLNHYGDKFASRRKRCVFLGYPYGKKGWRLYDLDKEEIFNSRDVVFQEDTFPFLQTPKDQTTSNAEPSLTPMHIDDDHEPLTNDDQTPTPDTETTQTDSNNSLDEVVESRNQQHVSLTSLLILSNRSQSIQSPSLLSRHPLNHRPQVRTIHFLTITYMIVFLSLIAAIY